MNIKLLVFGAVREIVGGTTAEVQCGGSVTAGELRDLLMEQYKGLRQLSSFMLAVNNEYADEGLLITGNEEIAIIPPVSGG